MDFEALVRTITQKVLAELSGAASSALTSAAPYVLVLGANKEGLEARLRAELPPGSVLRFSAEAPGAASGVASGAASGATFCALHGAASCAVPGAAPSQSERSQPERIILPYLSCTAMADLAAGRAACPQTTEVIRLLLAGRTIEVLDFAYEKYHASAPAALYELYRAYEVTLRSFGLTRFVAHSAASLTLREPLLTEAHVLDAHKNGVQCLTVPADALVTPAAVDAAKDCHILIDKRL